MLTCLFKLQFQMNFKKMAQINIGYTAGIETHLCSPQWLPKCNEMDKVLVVSNHAKTSLVNTVAQATNQQTGEVVSYKIETPVDVVWENTERHEPEEIEGLSLKHDFNFLAVSQISLERILETWLSGLSKSLSIKKSVLLSRQTLLVIPLWIGNTYRSE